MRWRKQGLIYCPDGSRAWAQSHAMIPIPYRLDDERIRLFLSSTDKDMVGRVGYVDVDARDPGRILEIADDPVLDRGEAGCFDDNGINATSIVRCGEELWMYYFGYQLGVQVRYLLFGGLAISRDGGRTFQRHSRAPIIDRTDQEPLLRSAPFVRREDGVWRMWYVGGERHIEVDGTTRPTYELRYQESADGITWPDESQPAVRIKDDGDEYGLGRPYVWRHDQGYRLWYSMRTRSLGYRVGYAESADGRTWSRRDDVEGLEPSPAGWDSQMVCYAAELALPDRSYLFYNGNEYGRSGFGYAVREPGPETR